jgi:hypothetical protein
MRRASTPEAAAGKESVNDIMKTPNTRRIVTPLLKRAMRFGARKYGVGYILRPSIVRVNERRRTQ